MTDYEELLTAVAAGLPGAGGLGRAFGAAASVFEAIRFAADSYADTDPELFAAWLLTAAEAADGRDALLHAASAPPGGLASAPPLAAGQLDGMAGALTGLLAAAGAHADAPGDAAACERAGGGVRRPHPRPAVPGHDVTATFGDFLDRAASGLSETASVRDLPSSTVIASAVQFRRLVTALSRYVADPPTFPEPAEATTIGVRLYQAATSLHRAADAGAGLAGPGAAHPLPARIAGAASGLTAGLDLLATHHATGMDGASVPLSPWAPALASSPARAMLLAELADLAVLAGSACRALATVPSPALPEASRNSLLAASGQLATIRYVPRQGPGHPLAAYRQLLRAVPPAITPARQPAGPPKELAELTQAIRWSAERIRYLIWQSRTARAWPPPPGLAAWRWSAHAAAIADHICEQIITGLAERAGQLMPGETTPTLPGAAATAGMSWNAWRQAASTCGTLHRHGGLEHPIAGPR